MSARFRSITGRAIAPAGVMLFVAFLIAIIAQTIAQAQSDTSTSKPKLEPFSDRSDPDETPTPKPKAKPEKSPAKTKKGDGSKSKAKASPEPSKTPKAKKSPTPDPDDEEETPAPKKKASPAKKEDAKKKSKASPKPSPKASAHPEKKGDDSDDDRSDEKPKPSAHKPTPEPKPSATPPPRAVAVPSSAPAAVVAEEITVQKSGFEEAQGYQPPPPPPPRRSFWSRLFGARESTANYRYLSRGVIDAIRNAPVQRGRWKFLIVHNSGTRQGNARAFDYYHRHVRRMQNGMAYHFVVGNGTSSGNGQVEIGDRWRRQINGGHVHSDYLNNISLGICLVGDFNRDQPTRAQLDACDELIRYLRTRCGRADGHEIPVRPHREMNPPQWATDCPGDSFPYGWFRRF